jgi:hypothetical protein
MRSAWTACPRFLAPSAYMVWRNRWLEAGMAAFYDWLGPKKSCRSLGCAAGPRAAGEVCDRLQETKSGLFQSVGADSSEQLEFAPALKDKTPFQPLFQPLLPRISGNRRPSGRYTGMRARGVKHLGNQVVTQTPKATRWRARLRIYYMVEPDSPLEEWKSNRRGDQ